jgi:hypothetical protein
MCKPDINLAVLQEVVPSGKWPCIPMREDMGDDEFRRIVGLPENFSLSDGRLLQEGYYWIQVDPRIIFLSNPLLAWFNGSMFMAYEDEFVWPLSIEEVVKIGPRIQVPENF